METRSNDINRFVCEASSNPPSAINWDAVMSGNRELLESGVNPSYSISSSVDLEASPPVSNSYLEYIPDEVDFRTPECFISNGFDTMRVRMFEDSPISKSFLILCNHL